ncbi:hypothetical protein WN51_01135 [Melipona quadrifasciata]|uniref:Uncharacterized protein n=1 Tax=Melipona quadrifasciata TaxID=166423 RepID=A0A0N0U4U5_9HYME|nr:hypothetical protein WN51_01135 [Melipona quadrifasciata]
MDVKVKVRTKSDLMSTQIVEQVYYSERVNIELPIKIINVQARLLDLEFLYKLIFLRTELWKKIVSRILQETLFICLNDLYVEHYALKYVGCPGIKSCRTSIAIDNNNWYVQRIINFKSKIFNIKFKPTARIFAKLYRSSSDPTMSNHTSQD